MSDDARAARLRPISLSEDGQQVALVDAGGNELYQAPRGAPSFSLFWRASASAQVALAGD